MIIVSVYTEEITAGDHCRRSLQEITAGDQGRGSRQKTTAGGHCERLATLLTHSFSYIGSYIDDRDSAAYRTRQDSNLRPPVP